MKTKKILMIGWEYPPQIHGGLGIASHGIAKALGELGHKILFVLPRITGHEPKEKNVFVIGVNSKYLPFSKEELQKFLLETLHLQYIDIYQSKFFIPPEELLSSLDISDTYIQTELLEVDKPFYLEGGYGHNLFFEIQAFAEFVARLASKLKSLDLIHAHDWMTFPAALYAKHLTNLPIILHVHATEFDRSGENPNPYVFNLEKYAFEKADAIITVSNYTKSILVEKYGIAPDKIYPVYNAVDFQYVEPKEVRKPIRQKIVLFVGRITFQKGPDYFVRAARKVIERIQNVKFLMVGTGDMYSRMIEMAADLGIGKYFHYTGFVPREKIPEIFKMSDVYVLPSVSEPFGLTVLEALKAGVPVIVSKQAGVSEIVQNAIKVDFWDVEDIANQIIKILEDEEFKHQLKQRLQEDRINEITWYDSARKVEEIYEQVLKEKQKR
ncbi:MAG: glycosyltransferase family 4 protein [Leptospiraceae bacterium]|nr:glycosyltransferase family 4 protein [Leptospiraceae bacterium]MDW7974933.1 glycosyltransferase family 4 protein [Leptospiraceae bacterium]